MNTKRIEMLKQAIEHEKQIIKDVRGSFQFEQSADDNENASNFESMNSMTSLMQHSRKKIQQLQASIQVLESNFSTRCLDCDEEIPWKRLLARPDAIRCKYCQEEFESEQVPQCSYGLLMEV